MAAFAPAGGAAHHSDAADVPVGQAPASALAPRQPRAVLLALLWLVHRRGEAEVARLLQPRGILALAQLLLPPALSSTLLLRTSLQRSRGAHHAAAAPAPFNLSNNPHPCRHSPQLASQPQIAHILDSMLCTVFLIRALLDRIVQSQPWALGHHVPAGKA